MKNVTLKQDDTSLVVGLAGRIDSNNAAEVESEIQQVLGGAGKGPLVIDAEELEYISSAGLRVILHLRKSHQEL